MDAATRKSLSRIISQGLVKETAALDAHGAVHMMLAIQAQQPSAVPWAINLRLRSPAIAEINAAFESCQLVRSWPMRGTIHETSARDHHWLRRVLLHRYDSWMRSFAEEGLTTARIERAAQIAYASMDAHGPVSREELCVAWEEAGIRTGTRPQREAAERAGEKGTFLDRRNLFLALHICGFLAAGPKRGNSFLFIDARQLPGAQGVGRGEDNHEAALTLLARRYAWGHGPVDVEDLARWASLTKREAAAALARAQENRPDEEFPIELGEFGYQRADLNQLFRLHHDEARSVFSCPSFDEIHVGYSNRACLADTQAEYAICPTKNGMFRPFVISNGRVIAVRDPRAGYQFVDSYKGPRTAALLDEAEQNAHALG